MRYVLNLIIILGCIIDVNGQTSLDKEAAVKAFELLKDIRTNPKKYNTKFKFLNSTKIASTQLIWNDTLAKVAEEKAMDMAKRRYFGHTDPDGNGVNYLLYKKGYKLNRDWYKNKSTNYFESIASGYSSAIESIEGLIIDKNEPRLGHRIHLLGLDDWNASLHDIGIAFVKADSKSPYKSYMVIIIAKHDW